MGLFKTAFNFASKHVNKAINLANEYDKANGRRFSKGLAKMAGKGINMISNAHPLAKMAANKVGNYIVNNSDNKHLQKFGKGLRGDSVNTDKILSGDIKKPTQYNNINNSNNTNNGRHIKRRGYANLLPARL